MTARCYEFRAAQDVSDGETDGLFKCMDGQLPIQNPIEAREYDAKDKPSSVHLPPDSKSLSAHFLWGQASWGRGSLQVRLEPLLRRGTHGASAHLPDTGRLLYLTSSSLLYPYLLNYNLY